MKNIEYKEPEIGEYTDIANLINKCDEQYKNIHTTTMFDALGYGSETKESLIEGMKNRIYKTMYKNEKLIGFSSFRRKNQTNIWISMFYIDTNYHGEGYGSLFLSEIKDVKQLGCQIIALETDEKAIWANNFYLKNQYSILSEKDLEKSPFDTILEKPPVKGRNIFGKILYS